MKSWSLKLKAGSSLSPMKGTGTLSLFQYQHQWSQWSQCKPALFLDSCRLDGSVLSWFFVFSAVSEAF